MQGCVDRWLQQPPACSSTHSRQEPHTESSWPCIFPRPFARHTVIIPTVATECWRHGGCRAMAPDAVSVGAKNVMCVLIPPDSTQETFVATACL